MLSLLSDGMNDDDGCTPTRLEVSSISSSSIPVASRSGCEFVGNDNVPRRLAISAAAS